MTKSLGAQSLQLPKIGVDLENIAAALAEAQKAAAGQIATLEAQLQGLDDLIGQAVDMEKDIHLSAPDKDALKHVTVLGHSYGSTTVADAFALHNMHANDAVLLGCPGTDLARSAAGLHLDGGHVFVGDASTDPVGMLGQPDGLSKHYFGDDIAGQVLGHDPGLGVDPAADGFGSVRFRAEVPGSDGINPHDHSYYYYHRGSEAPFTAWPASSPATATRCNPTA